MRLEHLLIGVNVPACGALHPQRLDGADRNDRAAAEILCAQLLAVGNIDYRQAVGGVMVEQRLPVRMARCFQRFEGLGANRFGRHQPEDQRRIRTDIVPRGKVDGVRRQQGLAAAGWDPDTDFRQKKILMRFWTIRHGNRGLTERRAAGSLERDANLRIRR
ncbi:MAG TPA: hypothetical protein VMP00_11190, partial [Burkholderiales bacterium]|nr:hypothetical protein [Burkholderiales bacterium]